MLKKLTICIAVIALCCSYGGVAFAESPVRWVRVTKDDVHLYSTSDSSKIMFTLEKSYYVEVLSDIDGMYFVAVMQNDTDFPRITGYVRKSEVEICDAVPLAPYYPTQKIVVTSSSAAIKLSPLPSAKTELTATNTQQLSYYGKMDYYGISWYYVYYAGTFGYVETNYVSAVNIPLHPTPLVKEPSFEPTDTPANTEPTTPDEPSKLPTSEILLIVFVVLLAVGLTLALFLPGNGRKNNVFEQDI